METIEHNGKTYVFDTLKEWNNLKVIEVSNFMVKGQCCLWDQESKEYRIFIKKELSDREKLETFVHEMIHLYHGDLERGGDIQEIEARTHRETKEILSSILI